MSGICNLGCMATKIIASGSFLPEKIVTNADLSKIVDTTDEWIVQRTGINERRIAQEGELVSDMGAKALTSALKSANISPLELDAIILATTTPDLKFPATACIIQDKVGAKNAFAFDVQAVCSGFVYAISIADSFIKSGKSKKIAVIGAEKLSSIINWQDRSTCVLFSDGAGAVILSQEENNSSGILDWKLHSNGALSEILRTDKDSFITMNGREVFKYATNAFATGLMNILEKNNLKSQDLSAVLLHQANSRIAAYVAEKLGLPLSLFPMTLHKYGNNSAATIPILFDECMRAGRFKNGDIIAIQAVGGGMTDGSLLYKF